MEGKQFSKTSQKCFAKRIVARGRFKSALTALTSKISGKLAWRARFSATLHRVEKATKQEEKEKIPSSDEEPQEDKANCLGEVVNVTLPENLVETILAMVPFPCIFKARALSKSWRARFEPIPSLDDEVQKRAAISFQKAVMECSSNWKTFCPVFIDLEEGLLAVDRESQNSRKVASVSFLPSDVRDKRTSPSERYRRQGMFSVENKLRVTRQQIDGALLLLSWFHTLEYCSESREGSCSESREGSSSFERRAGTFSSETLDRGNWVGPVGPTYFDGCQHPHTPYHGPRNWNPDFNGDWDALWSSKPKEHRLTVANVLTRRWRQLPSPPRTNLVYLVEKLVSQTSVGTYKVIVFYRGKGFYLAQIYDSKSNVWTAKTFVNDKICRLQAPSLVHLNGVLYMVCSDPENHILAFHVEEETFEEFGILGDILGRIVVNLVACNGDLLMVAHGPSSGDGWLRWYLLKLDLELRRSWEVAKAPDAALRVWMFRELEERPPFGSDGHCLFLAAIRPSCQMGVYNVEQDKWSLFPFPQSTGAHLAAYQTGFVFQPNLNTFMAV